MPLLENFLHEYREPRLWSLAILMYNDSEQELSIRLLPMVKMTIVYAFRTELSSGNPLPDPVDANGCFTRRLLIIQCGIYIKDADKTVIRILKEKKLLLDSAVCPLLSVLLEVQNTAYLPRLSSYRRVEQISQSY